jgi:hypothetical protein
MYTFLTTLLLSTAEAGELNMFAFDAATGLPETGDIALGFNAVPVLDFGLNAINIMNNTGQTASGLADYPAGTSGSTSLKYFMTETEAVRVRVAFNYDSSVENSLYTNPVEDADPDNSDPGQISDKVTTNFSSILLSGGYEWRRGNGRIQGLAGAEGMLGVGSLTTTTSYGWDYDDEAADFGVIADGSSRTVSERSGLGLSIGVRGFVGMEYFIADKISLGTEYGWAVMRSSQGAGSVRTESWVVDADGNGDNETDTDETGTSSSFSALHDNGMDAFTGASTGAITLNFHF